MFDIALSEVIVIGVVALVVVGPERLPAVARTVGKVMGNLQRHVTSIKSELRNEMIMSEWKNAKMEAEKSIYSIKSQVELADLEVRHEGMAAGHAFKEALSTEAPSTAKPEGSAAASKGVIADADAVADGSIAANGNTLTPHHKPH